MKNLRNTNAEEFMGELDVIHPKQLEYSIESRELRKLTIYIDEEIKEPSYYRHVCHVMRTLTENDIVVFSINSPGGLMSGLSSLLSAISSCDASKVATIDGSCHSAASILALHCDEVHVCENSEMLVHFISHGSSGKSADVKAQVDFTHNLSEKLFRRTYNGFMTEQEIQSCISGAEFWFDSEEIYRRLGNMTKDDEDEEIEEDEGCCNDCESCSCNGEDEE